MEEHLLKNDTFTAEYRFAKDLVKAVIEMRTITVPDFWKHKLDNSFLTVAQRMKVKELFSKEWPDLDEHVKRFTSRDGRSEYGDRQFLLCIVQFIEAYKPKLKSEDEFLRICSRIAYVTACFMRKNDQSDAISIAVDRVYEILIDTFYPTMINENGPLIKDIRDHKYRFSYDLVKTLVEMRGIAVPELELPNSENFFFTSNHKNKVKELFAMEWSVLDKLLKSLTCKDKVFDYSDENLLRCMDKIVKDFGSEQNTKEEFVLVCARIAYAAAWFLNKNAISNANDLAVGRIHQMVKKTIHFNKYEEDEDYRFSCDLVKAILEMRSNPFSVREMSRSSNSFFMIAHQNKIEDILSREKPNLDEVMRKFTSKDESVDYSDSQFLLCMDQVIDDYKPEYKSKEEMVHACVRIAYIAACFYRANKISNSPGLAVDRMMKIVKDINKVSSSEDEAVLIMRTRDDHYRFAYDLVKSVLAMKSVPVSDTELPDPDNFLFTEAHRRKIEDLLSKESSQLDNTVEQFTNRYGLLDYSDSNFLRCMNGILKKYEYDLKTEEGLVHNSAIISYLAACFSEDNIQSNASFLAVNHIYEMIKDSNSFSKLVQEQVLIVKAHDDHYRFAYDLAKTVFEFKGIPVSPMESPAPDKFLFTDSYRIKVHDLLSKEWSNLDEMVTKVAKRAGRLDYSDNKFLHCMNQIIHDFQSSPKSEEQFLNVCTRIAYTAAGFLIKNCKSNATFLAVNRMYEMSKDLFCNKMEESSIKDEIYHFVYDLVRAALRIGNHSFKVRMPDRDDSPFTIKHRNEVQDFLSKEWPRLHQIVRRFIKTSTDIPFNDNHFLYCMQQIINDYETEQKSKEGLLLVCARIAYVATCFLRRNQKSNAKDLALDHIYQMRKKYLLRNKLDANSSGVDVRDDKYRFAYDLVSAVMELQGTPVPLAELPDPNNFLFTPQNWKKIKKLFRKGCSNINKIVGDLTNKDGNSDYSDETFQRCMEKIFANYKSEQVNKDGFVRLCARIAYPASYFLKKNKASNAVTLAVGRIHEMVRDIAYFNTDLEDNNIMEDAKDYKYRFAYDVVKAAVEMQGTQIPNIEFPDPEIFLFTDEHRRKMEDFFSKESAQLADLMKKFACTNGNLDYSDYSFVKCMDQIVIEYKHDCYTEERFVLLCSRIAYVASCFLKKMCRSNATLLAVNRIHAMVKDALSRGILGESSW